MQLVQARDGRSEQPAQVVFTGDQIKALHALLPRLEGHTALQKNPHPPESLAWASWMIAKLGGWDGYPKSKPPGPITIRHGLQDFHSIAQGGSWRSQSAHGTARSSSRKAASARHRARTRSMYRDLA